MNQPRPLTYTGPRFLEVAPTGLLSPARLGLMGIRYADGDPPAATPPADSPPADPATPPATPTATPPVPTPPPAAPSKDDDWDSLPDKSKEYVRGYRADKAKAEKELSDYKKAEEERTNRILEAAGIKKPDAAKTPEEIAEGLAADRVAREKEEASRTMQSKELAITRIALRPAFLVNVDRLLDSKSFTDKLAALDATDTAGLEKLLTEAVTNDASLRIAPVASRSGGGSHTGSTLPAGRKSKQDAIAERMNTRKG